MERRPLSRKLLSLTESQTLALSARAAKMKREGIDVVSLTAGEPDFPTPEHIKTAAKESIDNNFTKYTANKGTSELREAISEKFKTENTLHWSSSEILVSSGAKHSVFNALQAICNPGDEVIIPSPYWVSYPEMVKIVDAESVFIETTDANGFKLTPGQLEEAITDKTKVLILNSPGNPTGTVYEYDELEQLSRVIEKHGIYVISDEIYEHLVFDGKKHHSIGAFNSIRSLTITVNGVSKAFSMTGWRVGYLGAEKEIVSLASKLQGQVTSNANSIAQKAAYAALTSPLDEVHKMRDEFEKRRNYFIGALNEIPEVICEAPPGAFYAFARIDGYFGRRCGTRSIRNDVDLSEYLLVDGRVATVPGSAFGSGNYLRLSFASSVNSLTKGIQRMGEALSYLTP